MFLGHFRDSGGICDFQDSGGYSKSWRATIQGGGLDPHRRYEFNLEASHFISMIGVESLNSNEYILNFKLNVMDMGSPVIHALKETEQIRIN